MLRLNFKVYSQVFSRNSGSSIVVYRDEDPIQLSFFCLHFEP